MRCQPGGGRGILVFEFQQRRRLGPCERAGSLDETLYCESMKGFSGMILAYFGPETMMPVVSVIAAAIGAVMMFNRNILLYGRSLVERVRPHTRRR